MIRLDITVPDITEVLAAGYTVIRIYTDTSESGAFSTLDGTATLVAAQTGYSYVDLDGSTATWYKTAYYGSSPGEGTKSAAQQGGTIDAYCTAFDVRQELATGSGQAVLSEKHDQVVWEMCLEASRLIDRYKGLEDGAYMASGSEVRYFDGTGDGWLWLDDRPAVSLTTVEVEETDGAWTTWTTDDYYSWPYNETPIRRLDVNPKSVGSKSTWTLGPRRVKLTGMWGVSTSVPEMIIRACKIQVALWYKRAMQGWSDVGGMEAIGMLKYPRELDPDVRGLLRLAEPRRRIL